MTTTTTKDIRAQLDDIESKRAILAAQRDSIAFEAVVEKEPRAVKQAASINAELAELTAKEGMLVAALRTATKREAEAEAAERDGKERSNAEAAIALLETFATRGAALDKLFDRAIEEFNSMTAEIRQLDRLGYHPTSHLLVASNMATTAGSILSCHENRSGNV
jgi:hypothetical protein